MSPVFSRKLPCQPYDAMLVRRLALLTRQTYIEAIVSLALLSPAQVEAWLWRLVRDRKLSYSTVNQAASACRFLYATVLKQERAAFPAPMAKPPQRQPDKWAGQPICTPAWRPQGPA